MGHIGGANVQKVEMRFYFPILALQRDALQGNQVSKELMEQLFTYGVRPAVTEVLPRTCHHEWPLDFGDEQYRAMRHNGRVVYTPRTIPAQYMDRFVQCLHRLSEEQRELSWARGFFLHFQIQGCKQATKHHFSPPLGYKFPDPSADGNDEDSTDEDEVDEILDPVQQEFEDLRTQAVLDAIEPLNYKAFVPSNWFIDIGTTIHSLDAGYSLLIKTGMHHWLLSEMTQVGVTEIRRRIQKGELAGYYKDELAHLGDASGFRMEMKNRQKSGPLDVAYAQGYASGDKDLTSLKDNGHVAKHTEPRLLFSNLDWVNKTHFDPLEAVFRHAYDDDRPVDARLESRVPWAQMLNAHRHFDPERLAVSVYKVPSRDWWYVTFLA